MTPSPPETDAEESTRSLSIASAPFEDTLMIATRMRDTAFKRVLKTLPPGTEVKIDHVMPHDGAVLIRFLNGCVLAVMLEVLAPADLTFTNIAVVRDELDPRQPLHHLEP